MSQKKQGLSLFFSSLAKTVVFLMGFLIFFLQTSLGMAQEVQSDSLDQELFQQEAKVDTSSVALSLRQAMQQAAERNPHSLLAVEKIRESQGRAWEASSGLLPHVSAHVTQGRETINLATLGFDSNLFPLPSTLLGPFNVFDARINLLQNIFDWRAIETHRLGRAELRKTESEAALATEQARLQAGLAYLTLLQAEAQERGLRSDVKLAETFAKSVRDQNVAGISTGIDKTRAETQLSLTRSLLLQVQNKRYEAELRLKRALDLPLSNALQLSDSLQNLSEKSVKLEEALNQAKKQRLELKIARQTLGVQKLRKNAAEAAWFPDLTFAANYGANGNTPSKNLEETYQFGVQVGIPVFDGGLTLAKTMQAKSGERQAQILLKETETQVEQDVRLAYENLVQTQSRVASAKLAYSLAKRQIEQMRSQFRVGVSDSLGLVSSENALTRAREDYLAALAQYQAARMMLSYAQGEIEAFP